MDVHACQTRLSELVTKTISVIYSKISSTESRFVLHGFLSIAVDCIDGLVRFNKAFISRDDESNSEKPLRNPLIELIDTLSDELSLVNVNSSRLELLRRSSNQSDYSSINRRTGFSSWDAVYQQSAFQLLSQLLFNLSLIKQNDPPTSDSLALYAEEVLSVLSSHVFESVQPVGSYSISRGEISMEHKDRTMTLFKRCQCIAYENWGITPSPLNPPFNPAISLSNASIRCDGFVPSHRSCQLHQRHQYQRSR